MRELMETSAYFGLCLSIGGYLAGNWLRRRTGLALFNPLLVAIVLVIGVLLVFGLDYGAYAASSKVLGDLLVPSTVCLAIPLYRQLRLMRQHKAAVALSIFSGVLSSAVSVFAFSKLFDLSHEHYVTLLPKSITTAIGIGISEEMGGVVALTVAAIVITGILGNIIADGVFKLAGIRHPIAKGLALGTACHAMGTAKALELGEVEGAMGSLSIAVAGLMTVVMVPLAAGWM